MKDKSFAPEFCGRTEAFAAVKAMIIKKAPDFYGKSQHKTAILTKGMVAESI